MEAVSVGVNTIGDDSDTVYLTMTNAEPSVVGSFTANLQKGSIQKDFTAGTIEVTLTSDKSIEFGGMKTDAAYLNVKKVDGNFSGTLAAKGNVYTLRCY